VQGKKGGERKWKGKNNPSPVSLSLGWEEAAAAQSSYSVQLRWEKGVVRKEGDCLKKGVVIGPPLSFISLKHNKES